MHQLVIGFDGVKAETFSRGWTPFIKSLIDQGVSIELKEDLISRGWSEILLGKHAVETGALYEGPMADGSLSWTDKFKMSDVQGLGESVKPIWQVLNERGYRVGIMNLPTTFPAPEVAGFFVSGGGGGGPVSQQAADEQCYPSNLAAKLNDAGYIVDERFPTLLDQQRLYDPCKFFGRLELMSRKRTESFVQLSNEYQVDFGFIAYRSTVTAETLLLPELAKNELSGYRANSTFISAAKHFYSKLDEQVSSLVEAFPAAKVVLVSDHSMETRRYAVNANSFLIEAGYQKRSAGKQGVFRSVKLFKHLLPMPVKMWLKNSRRIKTAYKSLVTFNPAASQAFSCSFSNGAHGIYINDSERFGGPVAPADAGELAERIVREFNAHSVSQKYGFRAYKKVPSTNPACGRKFPDIVLDLPDCFQTTSLFREFVRETKLPLAQFRLRDVKKDLRLVGKAHTPLAVCARSEWNLGHEFSRDLTSIYFHICEEFSAS